MMAVSTALLIAGCGTTEEKPPPRASWTPPDVAEVYDRRPPASPSEAGEPETGVGIDIAYTQIGKLHRGYFGNQALLDGLSKAAATCVRGTLDLVVTYDEKTREGRVVGSVPQRELLCPITVEGDALVLDALRPLSVALANYRNAVAEAKDIRVYAFRTGIHVRDGKGAGIFWVEGQDPIDGSTFSPCVTVDGVEACAPGKRLDGFRRLTLPKEITVRMGEIFSPPRPTPSVATPETEPPPKEAVAP